MKKIIATTTINPPTKALLDYTKLNGWHVVVAGDLKTNHNLYKNIDNLTYLTPDQQQEQYPKLSELIGWNCIERRNLAIIYAYDMGADAIALIDDDNIPYQDWGQDLCINKEIEVTKYITKDIAFDPIGSMEKHKELWHRGFPLERIPFREYDVKEKSIICPKVQVLFWDGDPDVDAICRMIYNPKCKFNPNNFPFTSSKPAPFNSQNIILSRDVIIDYFLFPETERMQDIWAAYYLQSKGHQIVFTKPAVYSDRAMGSLGRYSVINDMKKEYLGMENNLNLLRELNENSENIKNYISEKSWDSFMEWRKLLKK